ACAAYGEDAALLYVHVHYLGRTRVRIHITEDKEDEGIDSEAPFPLYPGLDSSHSSPFLPRILDYNFTYTQQPFTFALSRVNTQVVIFNSSLSGSAGLRFSQTYRELSTSLPEPNFLFGLGEREGPLRINTSHTQYFPMWSREHEGGVHPIYLDLRGYNHEAHGVTFLGTHPSEIQIAPGILTHRVIGGDLDLLFCLGPTPTDVMDQLTRSIGRPFLPPYWSLGWHQAYTGTESSTSAIRALVGKYEEYQLPLEALWMGADFLQDLKVGAPRSRSGPSGDSHQVGLPQMRALAHVFGQRSLRIVTSLDPLVPHRPQERVWKDGVRDGAFLQDSQGKPVVLIQAIQDEGDERESRVAIPDWSSPGIVGWWRKFTTERTMDLPVDGKWRPESGAERDNTLGEDDALRRNAEDQKEKKDEKVDPVFSIRLEERTMNYGGGLASHTIPLHIKDSTGRLHQAIHNVYGHESTRIMRKVSLNREGDKRPLVLSKSTFIGTGQYAGHILESRGLSWRSMALSIPAILRFQLYGIPFVGMDICASIEMEDELCRRWYQLGALYPLARNHHFPSPFPSPDYWPQPTDIAKKFIRLRYRLLPYLYTLFHGAHLTGNPVWRPLWYEFPRDVEKSAEIEGQFLLGPSILVTPILSPGITLTQGYFPPGVWYGLEDGLRIQSHGEVRVLGVRADSIPLHIRGGSVLVTQEAEGETSFTTTAAARKLDYQLLIGLDDRGMAQGRLYLDDGET
ncbi:glycosyl hydrolases family 31-domain-containing protein, partial [Piptocephalis cylindrospora]